MIAFRLPVGIKTLHELQVKALQNSQTESSELHSEQKAIHSQGSEIKSGESSGKGNRYPLSS